MMKEYEGQNFKELTASDNPVLIQYYAEWCGPCQMLKPILDQIAKEMHDVDFYRVDIDSYRDLAIGEGIQSIPTVVLYKGGKEVSRDAGFKPKHLMENWLNSNK